MKVDRPMYLVFVLAGVLGGAVRTEASYTLTITATHGRVNVVPEAAGAIVRLVPIPDAGCMFTGWSGGITSRRLALEIRMTGHLAVTAHFGPWAPPLGIPTPPLALRRPIRCMMRKEHGIPRWPGTTTRA